jgi:hypothetical protein
VTHTYTCYGQILSCEFELPGLRPVKGVPSIEIRRRDGVADSGVPPGSTELFVGTHRVLVSESKVFVQPTEEVSAGVVESIVLGAGLGTTLALRGHLVLHGSAVERDGSVVGFIGPSGAGKSTTAATLADRGWNVVADDALAIRVADSPVVFPGPVTLKIEDSVATALESSSLVASLEDGTDRNYYRFTRPVYRPLTLNRLYVLAEGGDGDCYIDSPDSQRQPLELLANVFSRHRLRDPEPRRSHFEQATALADAIPVRRLVRNRQQTDIESVMTEIEQDMWNSTQ